MRGMLIMLYALQEKTPHIDQWPIYACSSKDCSLAFGHVVIITLECI